MWDFYGVYININDSLPYSANMFFPTMAGFLCGGHVYIRLTQATSCYLCLSCLKALDTWQRRAAAAGRLSPEQASELLNCWNGIRRMALGPAGNYGLGCSYYSCLIFSFGGQSLNAGRGGL